MRFIKDVAADTACVYLDLEDTKLPDNLGVNIEPLLHFNIDKLKEVLIRTINYHHLLLKHLKIVVY